MINFVRKKKIFYSNMFLNFFKNFFGSKKKIVEFKIYNFMISNGISNLIVKIDQKTLNFQLFGQEEHKAFPSLNWESMESYLQKILKDSQD